MSSTPNPAPKNSTWSGRLVATLRVLFRTRVTAGLLTVLPIYVTYLLIRIIFDLLKDSSSWVIELYLRSPAGERVLAARNVDLAELAHKLGRDPTGDELIRLLPVWLQWAIPGLCVAVTILLLYGIGLLTANVFGARLVTFAETLVDRVPLVKTVYRATKQILSIFAGDQAQSFQRVCLVPFPDQSMRAIAFITNIYPDHQTGEELCSVFIITTPNPTTGYLQIMRRADLTEVDWSVEDAVRAIMSGGIYMPPTVTMVPNKLVVTGTASRPAKLPPA